ncbi:hypothetical protein ABB55_21725 [Prosthecomicrobium hirschii]|uniref:Phage tail protein n=1 Tax=Prosthecodimorpha hirschii TaxID=665126 RepID=A0A0P6VRT3_9HYPH|nr:phage tail tape measure protein [Prosthecomicrobium hirschii]KPL54517.1 hypothetical protein ABB55_21725 [Prosthecomicrobium hirschii]
MTDSLGDVAATSDQLAGTLGELGTLSRSFGLALSSAFRGAVIQGRELDTVLRGIAYQMSDASLARALSPITGGITSGLESTVSSLFKPATGFRLGGVLGGGRVMPFAAGGIVSQPTYFPLAGGRTGLMGEAGAEAIMPLRRGPDGRLGVAAAGGSAPVSVTVHIETPDIEGFRRSEGLVATKLARAVGRGRRGL